MKLSNKFQNIILIGILIAIIFAGYQLFLSNSSPSTKMDCLKLGSDTRAKACLELLASPSSKNNFPIEQLNLENIESYGDPVTRIRGTVHNNYNLLVKNVKLKVDFYKGDEQNSFHYEVFSPFNSQDEEVQPNSKKSFDKFLHSTTRDIISNNNGIRYEVMLFSADL